MPISNFPDTPISPFTLKSIHSANTCCFLLRLESIRVAVNDHFGTNIEYLQSAIYLCSSAILVFNKLLAEWYSFTIILTLSDIYISFVFIYRVWENEKARSPSPFKTKSTSNFVNVRMVANRMYALTSLFMSLLILLKAYVRLLKVEEDWVKVTNLEIKI